MTPAQPEPAKLRVVVIDDEESLLLALKKYLSRIGFEVHAIADPVEGLAAVADLQPNVVMLDIRMPNLSGMDLLAEFKAKHPRVEVVMMTGHATIETAVQAVKTGAYDYLTKPFESLEHVALTLRKASERQKLLTRMQELEGLLEIQDRFEDLIGRGAKMQAVFRLIEAVSPSDATVLIQGESGTGKELVARALHRRSPRKERPFVAVNCSAFAETLLESELFGYAKGAFTGAMTARKGLFEAAQGGTLFLDEIGDISPGMQVRLLRSIQEGEVRRVGSNESVKVDVRIIAATHVNLEQAKDRGRFREDLFYRLNVVTVALPPLRERPEDVPSLAAHFLQVYGRKLSRPVSRISPEAMEALTSNRWRGNVRELENVIERAVLLGRAGEITVAELPPGFTERASTADLATNSLAKLPYVQAKRLALRAFDRRYLSTQLKQAGGNISSAARTAGLDRSNFRRLMRQCDVISETGEESAGAPLEGTPADESDGVEPVVAAPPALAAVRP